VARQQTQLGYARLAACHSAKDWFIVDRAHLENSFRGKVALLAFTREKRAKIPLVVNTPGALRRQLSKSAKSNPELNGSVAKNEQMQNLWRQKVDFVVR
jgi:hypothetical protein